MLFCLNKGEPPSNFKNFNWPIVYEYCEGKVKRALGSEIENEIECV